MPNMDDFHAYKSTNGGNGGNGGSGGFCCGGAVIAAVIVMLICFIANGESWDAIETLLGLGFIAFLYFRWIST